MKTLKLMFNKKIFYKYFLLMLLVCIFSINEIPDKVNYFGAFYSAFYGLIYPILSYLFLVIFSFELIAYYDKNYAVFLRYKGKQEYIEKLLNYCFLNIAIAFWIFILLLFVFVFLSQYVKLGVFNINVEAILMLFILFYNVFKIFIMTELIIKLGILLSKAFSKVVAAIFLIGIEMLKFSWVYNLEVIDSFDKIPLFYGYYFTHMKFNSIFLDVFSFLLQILIFVLIIEISKRMILKYKKIYIEG